MLYCQVFHLNTGFIIVLQLRSFKHVTLATLSLDVCIFLPTHTVPPLFPVMVPEQGDGRAVTGQKHSLASLIDG